MKKVTTAFVTAGLLLCGSPAFASEYPKCDGISSITRRTACERLYQQSDYLKKGTDMQNSTRATVDLLHQIRLNRRSDLLDRNRRANKVSNADTLAQRRTEALQERQARIEARRARKKAQAAERQAMLQQRVRTQFDSSIRGNVVGKESLREKAAELRGQSQSRRNALKRAQEKCADSRGTTTYQQCLKDARAKLMK